MISKERFYRTVINNTCGTSQTKKNGIRAAIYDDAIRIIGIHRHGSRKVITSQVSTRQSTDSGVRVRSLELRILDGTDRSLGIWVGKIAPDTAYFRTCSIDKQFLKIGGIRVFQKLLGYDADGRGNIL